MVTPHFPPDTMAATHRVRLLAPYLEQFGWEPKTRFADGLAQTIDWYLENRKWWQRILDRGYQGDRIGLGAA